MARHDTELAGKASRDSQSVVSGGVAAEMVYGQLKCYTNVQNCTSNWQFAQKCCLIIS